MMDDRSHPLLQQTPLTVNPFIDLPKAPILPHTYASLPSTLPPSALHASATASAPNLPAYITSPTGDFAANPQTLRDQSRALLEQLRKQREDGFQRVEQWENEIRERDLREKRRRAPGWLDSEVRVLEPERGGRKEDTMVEGNLMDAENGEVEEQERRKGEELGNAMDRVFGKGSLGG